MEAKMKDLIKSGLVWVRFEDCRAFVEFLCKNNIKPKIGNVHNGGMIIMFGGALLG